MTKKLSTKAPKSRRNFDGKLILPRGLTSIQAIQKFIDSLRYSHDDYYRCPAEVLRDGKAHCFDGALLAAAAVRRIGLPPLIFELVAERDTSHVLCVFRRNGAFGALGKSNFAGLGYREPIYRNLRELALSYFESYFNFARERTLRSYSTILDLRRADHLDWETRGENMQAVASMLDNARHYSLLTAAMRRGLSRLDKRTFKAGCYGVRRIASLSRH